MDGRLGEQANKVESFIQELRKQTEVPICFRDERLSTVSAKRLLQGKKKTKEKTRHDAVAAAIILQSYLDEAL